MTFLLPPCIKGLRLGVVFFFNSDPALRCSYLVFIWNLRSCRPDVFCKKDVLKHFVTQVTQVFSDTDIFWQRCFPANFEKFLRMLFFNRTPLVAPSEICIFCFAYRLSNIWNGFYAKYLQKQPLRCSIKNLLLKISQ